MVLPSPVKRIAWVTRPEATSSYRVRPGRMAKPAASAEVQPSGRNWLERRLNTAPFAAAHDPSGRGLECHVSYSVHDPALSIDTCRSPDVGTGLSAVAPWIIACLGYGYGPRSECSG